VLACRVSDGPVKATLLAASSEGKELWDIHQLCADLEASIDGAIYAINKLWK
jgi:hypothetical protein